MYEVGSFTSHNLIHFQKNVDNLKFGGLATIQLRPWAILLSK